MPRSRRKRSLSSFSPVVASQKRHVSGEVLLGDEISPDTCRFWDATTGEKLDKDRFRRDLGNIEEAYKEMLFRLTGERA